MLNDPNGYAWPRPKPYPDGGSWRRVFFTWEAWIESKAGACPPRDDWPLPEPREPNCPEYLTNEGNPHESQT